MICAYGVPAGSIPRAPLSTKNGIVPGKCTLSLSTTPLGVPWCWARWIYLQGSSSELLIASTKSLSDAFD